jgi:type I restriction enzyme M protein
VRRRSRCGSRAISCGRPIGFRSSFPRRRLRDVEGLVKLVDRAAIKAHDRSLTPGRYVCVVPEEQDEDFDFEEPLRALHIDLKGLNEGATELAERIAQNFEELGA